MEYTNLALSMIEAARQPNSPQRPLANFAGRQLAEVALRLARSVHFRHGYLSRQQYQDYLDEAPGKAVMAVLVGFKYSPGILHGARTASEDPVCAFLRTTLENHYHNFGRAAKRSPRQLTSAPEADDDADPLDRFPAAGGVWHDGVARLISEDVADASLSAGDCGVIDNWKPADAVVLLGVSGLARKLSPAHWTQLQRACKIAFPGVCRDFSDPQNGREALAALLGVTRNAIDQRWRRGWDQLMQLQFVRTLADELRAGRAYLAVAA